jgi:acyl carrier protein
MIDMNQEEALKWIAELFEEPVDDIKPETQRDEIPMWDSLGVLTLMAEVDEKFGLVLSDEDMKAMSKVGDILQVLEKNGKIKL